MCRRDEDTDIISSATCPSLSRSQIHALWFLATPLLAIVNARERCENSCSEPSCSASGGFTAVARSAVASSDVAPAVGPAVAFLEPSSRACDNSGVQSTRVRPTHVFLHSCPTPRRDVQVAPPRLLSSSMNIRCAHEDWRKFEDFRSPTHSRRKVKVRSALLGCAAMLPWHHSPSETSSSMPQERWLGHAYTSSCPPILPPYSVPQQTMQTLCAECTCGFLRS